MASTSPDQARFATGANRDRAAGCGALSGRCDNIRYGRPEASEAEVIAAAQAAQAHGSSWSCRNNVTAVEQRHEFSGGINNAGYRPRLLSRRILPRRLANAVGGEPDQNSRCLERFDRSTDQLCGRPTHQHRPESR
jgi:hypothetical protein